MTTKTRVSQRGILEREANIAAEEASIKRLETITESKKIPAIQILLESIKRAHDGILSQLAHLAGNGISYEEDNSVMRQLGGELKAYKAILNDFGDPSKAIEAAKGRIEQHKNVIKQARANEGLVIQ